MIKAIIFDLGGVVFTNGTRAFVDYLSLKYGLDRDRLATLMTDGEPGNSYREGNITRDEFWTRIQAELHLPESIDELERKWIDEYKLIGDMKDVLHRLRETYKVYYLSDNVRERVQAINTKYNFLTWFDDGLFSHEVGFRKPDVRIYKTFLEKFGLKPEETLFVDDKQSNVTPAEELGMNALVFTDSDVFKNDLKKIGLMA